MLNNLSKETWLPENTQVRTPTGWENIYSLDLGDPVLSIRKGKVIIDTIQHIGKTEMTTKVTQFFNKDKTVHALNIHMLCNPWITEKVLNVEHLSYKGPLYHLRTRSNILIFRTFKDYHATNHDYTLALCHVK